MSLEDTSQTAGLILRNYEPARDAALRSYPWNCAMKRASLAASATSPVWGDEYAYPLPVDCLRVLETQNDLTTATRWRIEGRSLLSADTGPVNIRYIAKVEDPAQFDALLVDAIAARLAYLIAYATTGTSSAMGNMQAVFQAVMLQARRIDAQEQSQDEQFAADTWLTARY